MAEEREAAVLPMLGELLVAEALSEKIQGPWTRLTSAMWRRDESATRAASPATGLLATRAVALNRGSRALAACPRPAGARLQRARE